MTSHRGCLEPAKGDALEPIAAMNRLGWSDVNTEAIQASFFSANNEGTFRDSAMTAVCSAGQSRRRAWCLASDRRHCALTLRMFVTTP
ncbi:unnamed protein product, partial [Nippostrongylus brasiliensis]|uniref:Lipoprotein n=1 Tax=Nippostrongylus brasiliensis TaxID=27835 RepID=A0A0N4XSA1_NIPBR